MGRGDSPPARRRGSALCLPFSSKESYFPRMARDHHDFGFVPDSFNGDLVVNTADFNILRGNFGSSGGLGP